jgi:hypothetical protein
MTHTYYNAVAVGSGPVAFRSSFLGGSVAAEVAAAANVVSRLLTSIIADDDDDGGITLSVIAFIILYGLVPRNDLGKYCSSTDGAYSDIAVTPVVGVAFAVVSL